MGNTNPINVSNKCLNAKKMSGKKKTIKYNKQQNQPFAAISKELLKVMLKN